MFDCYCQQVPPLTPGTNKKVGEALKLTYGNWSLKADEVKIPADPRLWSESQVTYWLQWTMEEFSLHSQMYKDFLKDFKVSRQEY